jgi:ribosome maturation factor RimP
MGYFQNREVLSRYCQNQEVLLRYTPREKDPQDPAGLLFDSLEPVVLGLGLALVEVNLFRQKGNVQIRAVVYKSGALGLEDCSRVHHALLPRLELAFPGQDLYVEVSSPGIDRVIKDGFEFAYYIGRGVKCYRTDISDWSGGVLESADPAQIVLKGREGTMKVPYEVIAKAKLDHSQE